MPPLLLHHQLPPFLIQIDSETRVQLWIPSGLEQPRIWLRLEPDNEEELVPMVKGASRGRFCVFEASLIIDATTEPTVYAFKVLYADQQWWLDAAGISPRMPLRERFFRLPHRLATPDWVPDQIFYQIFPERFCNGDPNLGSHTGIYRRRGQEPVRIKAWGEPIDPQHCNREFYGGDLIGVRKRLDYLDNLGITALYLNPVFTSPSVHKYDIEDFEHVDPSLGGDRALAELRTATSKRGMRLVLDAVFNHCSDTHPWFNRWNTYPEPGAYASKHAPFRDAFIFHDADDPDSYHCWQGAKTLPVLDFANPKVQDYFYAGHHAIVRRWLRPPYAIDGWRLDVIHMLGEGTGAANNAVHVRALRHAAREENPDAYILGEHFFEATRWLQGDQEDGAMNYYGFAHPMRAFLAGQDVNYHALSIDAVELDQWLTDARSRISYPHQLCQLNLLGSHDTTRFLTLLGEDRALMRIALLLLFTYPGVPCVYYGDEIGMTGISDPYNRACFDWNQAHWDLCLLEFVRILAGLRREHNALRRGAYQTLLAEGDLFGFARFGLDEDLRSEHWSQQGSVAARQHPGQLITIVNRSTQPAGDILLDLAPLPDSAATCFRDLLTGTEYGAEAGLLRLHLNAKDCLLLYRSGASTGGLAS